MLPYCERHGAIGYMNYFPDVSGQGFDMEGYNRRFYDANIIINAKVKSAAYDPHWGPLSIKFATGGSEYYKSGDTLQRVDDDCFLIFNEGKYYQSWIESDTEVDSCSLNMTPAFERDALAALKASRTGALESYGTVEKIRFTERTYASNPHIFALVCEIRRLAEALGDHHARIQELFFSLYIEMVVLQEKTNREALATGKMRAASRQELYRRLLIAKDFLHSCFNEDVTLALLADVACLNQFYLLREFKKAFRCTPHQYLTLQRLNEAERILALNDTALESVCHAVGYSDPSSFSKLFRRHKGCTPAEFRAGKR